MCRLVRTVTLSFPPLSACTPPPLDPATSSTADSPNHTPMCRMEAAYSAALERVGGLEASKPKALLTLLAPQFPQLTLEVRCWQTRAGIAEPTWQPITFR